MKVEVCGHTHTHIYIYVGTHTQIYIYIYVSSIAYFFNLQRRPCRCVDLGRPSLGRSNLCMGSFGHGFQPLATLPHSIPTRFLPQLQISSFDTLSDTEDRNCGEVDQLMTRDVCTRWYKAPEMLFGSVTYSQGALLAL